MADRAGPPRRRADEERGRDRCTRRRRVTPRRLSATSPSFCSLSPHPYPDSRPKPRRKTRRPSDWNPLISQSDVAASANAEIATSAVKSRPRGLHQRCGGPDNERTDKTRRMDSFSASPSGPNFRPCDSSSRRLWSPVRHRYIQCRIRT